MIVTGDIGNIIYGECGAFGIADIRRGGNLRSEFAPVAGEYITIHVKEQRPETYWRKAFVEVNLCVPDFEDAQANLPRLNELERLAAEVFEYGNYVTGEHDGTQYRYCVDVIDGAMEDNALGLHHVHVRLLFETLNIL